MKLPEYKDSHRNLAIKKFAEELASVDTLRKLRDLDPMSPYLDAGELSDFLVDLENGNFPLISRDLHEAAGKLRQIC